MSRDYRLCKGTGTVNVRFSADQGDAFWVLPTAGAITDASAGKMYSNNDAHAWMSIEVKDTADTIVWVYRKINLKQ